MIKAGIYGGAGYTGGELIRILLRHPGVNISSVHSSSNAGKPVGAVHRDLIGDTDLVFSKQLSPDIDLVFLCQGHGKSRGFVESKMVPEEVQIIDLSQDFRVHTNGSASLDFVYGLPELNKQLIKKAHRIANPGCFATAIQLALLPLAANAAIRDEIHVSAITGSTGAGQSLSETTHFSWRNNNVSVYKPFTHQHLAEINQSLAQCQSGLDPVVNFIPVRGNFTRGILVSAYTRIEEDLETVEQWYWDYYKDHPFTLISGEEISLKEVVNTNKCLVHLEKHGNKIFVTSAIDNLVKGASGQAVQNMNLMNGYEETEGLKFKSIAF